MDINSMMGTIQQQQAQRLASGVLVSTGNGLSTSATATTGLGSKLASASPGSSLKTASSNAATSSTTSSSSSNGQITSNDFLTLLVSEMQNQDPTQPTDPNAYIQQLVEVNSLQQLISINSELAPTPTTTGGAGVNPIAGGIGSVTSPTATGVPGTSAVLTPSNSDQLGTLASTVGLAPVQGWLAPLSDT